MKRSDLGFKILSVTLMALLITGLLHRFTYSAFCMAKKGQVFWYNPDLWKQYYAYLPGKILCIVLAALILALLGEAVYFIFRRKKKMTAASEINKIIVRQLQRHKLEYEIDLDPNQDNQEVVFCDDENFGQQRIFKQCSEEELTLLFSALIENKALNWDIALEIAKLLPEKGHLIEDKFSIDDWAANPFYGFNQLLLAALGRDQKYESEIIKLLDTVPEDARDGVFMACEALNTPAICRKLMEKFTLWIKTDPDYGNGTGEGRDLVNFIALWQKTQDRKSVDKFTAFCRENWCRWEEK